MSKKEVRNNTRKINYIFYIKMILNKLINEYVLGQLLNKQKKKNKQKTL